MLKELTHSYVQNTTAEQRVRHAEAVASGIVSATEYITNSHNRAERNAHIAHNLRNKARRLDRYLKKPDTILATAINTISSETGTDYQKSKAKRGLDLAAGIPLSILTAPVTIFSAVSNKKNGHPIFYRAERLIPVTTENGNKLEPALLPKICTMSPSTDVTIDPITEARGRLAHEHPRVTRLGRFLRKHNIDEVPQLLRVIKGELSLVGVRPPDPDTLRLLKEEWSAEKYAVWEKSYTDGRPGLTGATQAMGSPVKDDTKRFPLDTLYAKKASLGFDLYIGWRTFARMVRLLP